MIWTISTDRGHFLRDSFSPVPAFFFFQRNFPGNCLSVCAFGFLFVSVNLSTSISLLSLFSLSTKQLFGKCWVKNITKNKTLCTLWDWRKSAAVTKEYYCSVNEKLFDIQKITYLTYLSGRLCLIVHTLAQFLHRVFIATRFPTFRV